MNRKDFLFVENLSADNRVASMRVNKPIGDGNGEISGPLFTAELDKLVNSGVKKIVVLINSPGGNVIHGFEIFSAIQDAPIEIETRVVGIAASIAGIIAQAGTTRTIKPYAFFMAHSPHGKRKTDSKVLEMAYNSVKLLLQSKSNISEDKITDILSKDTFMNAVEAKENGLFDEILDITNSETNIAKEATPEDVMNLVNEFNFKTNKPNMSKLNDMLGVANEASEASQLKALEQIKGKAAEVETLENKVGTLEAEKSKLSDENSELKTALAAQNKAKATLLIENAVTEGKLSFKDDTEKSTAIDNAVENYEATSLMLSSIKTVRVANHITPDKGSENNRSGWGFEKWSKEDPSGLMKIKNENPEKYEKMVNDYV